VSIHVEHVTCQQFVDILTDYLEGVVDPRLRADIERHIVICRGCANYAEQMRSTIDILARAAGEDASGDGSGELVGLFRRWRDEREPSA
jgi:anti-sigma factor RsiW